MHGGDGRVRQLFCQEGDRASGLTGYARFVNHIAACVPLRYHEFDGLFRDTLLVFPGFVDLWAKEVAGDCASGRQGAERIQASLERVQSADHIRDFSTGNGEPAAKSASFRPAGRFGARFEFAGRTRNQFSNFDWVCRGIATPPESCARCLACLKAALPSRRPKPCPP